MDFPELVPGEFIRRDNRFRATVKIEEQEAWAHVANSGRLSELFIPGRKVWLSRAENPERKTAYDLRLVEYNGVLVSVDARLPNPLFEEYLLSESSDVFKNIQDLKREVFLGDSRLDFRLEDEEDNQSSCKRSRPFENLKKLPEMHTGLKQRKKSCILRIRT